mmetsp:Transcript_38710/g.75577  ORF Transcript_38710/g.75577 Transcript_38710/m.75577 type:complete len:81 (-) Transcript_38710:257-499(-)
MAGQFHLVAFYSQLVDGRTCSDDTLALAVAVLFVVAVLEIAAEYQGHASDSLLRDLFVLELERLVHRDIAASLHVFLGPI